MPQILAISADATYTEGDNVTLNCSSSGGPDNLYQWQVNSTNIQGETFHELVLQLSCKCFHWRIIHLCGHQCCWQL